MQRIYQIVLLSCLMLAISVAFDTRPASAHAIIIESSPDVNATLTGPAVPVDLHFNSRIDKKRSGLTLLNPDKTSQRLAIPVDGEADRITTIADGLAPGIYQIEWQVLSIDGHITRGFIPFTVKAP